MKPLLILMLAGVVGVVAASGLFALVPRGGDSDKALVLQIQDLERELAELQEQPAALPTHHNWQLLEQHLDTYENLDIERLSAGHAGHPGFGGEQWGGIVRGPMLDLLLAARIVQRIVPVYFDRIAIEDKVARMTFYVLGAKES